MTAQGWYLDPYGSHDDRWFSGGEPTSLVRDQGIESFEEPPQGRPAPCPRERPAGERLPSAGAGRAGTGWPLWAAWLPGLLTLGAWGLLWMTPFFIIVALAVIGLLWAALTIPGWRPAIGIALWAAFVLSCGCILLLAYAISHVLNGWN